MFSVAIRDAEISENVAREKKPPKLVCLATFFGCSPVLSNVTGTDIVP